MQLMCAIDTETQGFDLQRDHITEIGAVVFNPITFEVVHSMNTLVYEPHYRPQTEEIVGITGITDNMLKAGGISFVQALLMLDKMIASSGGISHFVAHNAEFDRRVLHAELTKASDKIPDEVRAKYKDIPWVCTLRDVKHPDKFKSKKLAHLALDYGVPVDPRELHRAVADVQLMLQMLKAAKADFAHIVGRAAVADVIIRAIIPSPFGAKGDGGKGKDAAKANGFGWQKAPGTDGPTIELSWLKKVKEDEIEKEEQALGYKVKIVG